MIILGIDPGSVICGYGVVEKIGNEIRLIEYGVIEAKKINIEFNARLKEIFNRLKEVVERNKPDAAAFESIFYSKNPQSLIKLSHARAVAVLTCALADLPIAEYSAREVKKSVTGRGAAGKEQVQFMVKTLLNIKETPQFFDATDALAVAICHSVRYNATSGNSTNWSDFIKNKPEMVYKHQ